jgi:glutamyl-tRNA synthetase
MIPKVRFAPSPTGRLHVGNIRTALINWLFARSRGGAFVLRIDDTDTVRSTRAYEDSIRADLTWLGLNWDETFRQSERFDRYDDAAERLRRSGRLYPCYETADELERRRKIALSLGNPPIYDRAALALSPSDRARLEAEGRQPHWRFRLTGETVSWHDLVRGPQTIETASLSDPILIREDGSYLYTLPSVVDDIDADITHVVRGEDHVTNSAAQIEIFRALDGRTPEMAHMPLLIGADGQSLSKRLGSLSAGQLREQGIEPLSIACFLSKLGTSDPIAPEESVLKLVDAFSFDKIGRAPARFDEKDLAALNAQIVHSLPFSVVEPRLRRLPHGADATEAFWELIRKNLAAVNDVAVWLTVVYGDGLEGPLLDDEDRAYVKAALDLFPDGPVDTATWGSWTAAIKAATGRRGRGLFLPLRRVLTDQENGPEMDALLPLIGQERARKRLILACD